MWKWFCYVIYIVYYVVYSRSTSKDNLHDSYPQLSEQIVGTYSSAKYLRM